MPFDQFIYSLFQQATASGSRSTVLADLRWAAAIIFGALLAVLTLKAPSWILVFLAVILGAVFLLYFAAYVFFALRNPDYLRSEKYTLSKLAIEKSVKGDNIAGFIDPINEQRALQAIPPKEPKDE